jgi:4-hydroxy-2-oxoheptanedioate aldolase
LGFAQRLRAGEPLFGLSIMFSAPSIVEMAALAGFDWVLIDCEHGAIDLGQVEAMATAAQAHGIAAIGRPAAADPADVARLLDRGLTGIQVPHVATPAQAHAIVEAAKFAPVGRRSLAVGTRAGRYGMGLDLATFAASANADTVVCVQVEDREGLENVARIAAVDGVDVVFLGPSDLSQALGAPGHAQAPHVQEAMRAAFAVIRAAGKVAGSAGEGEGAGRYRREGATYLYTHVATLFRQGAAAFFTMAKATSAPA